MTLVDAGCKDFFVGVYVVVLRLLKYGLVEQPFEFLIELKAVLLLVSRKVVLAVALFLHVGQPSERVICSLTAYFTRDGVRF